LTQRERSATRSAQDDIDCRQEPGDVGNDEHDIEVHEVKEIESAECERQPPEESGGERQS
jgi:hypothetical protein